MFNYLIQSSPEILSGTPVFYGTRVPVQTLIDYLEASESASHTLCERLDDFLEDLSHCEPRTGNYDYYWIAEWGNAIAISQNFYRYSHRYSQNGY